MSELLKRVTINSEVCGGRPTIRGMRIRVVDVLELLASGMTRDEILLDHPDLEVDDFDAAIMYAVEFLKQSATKAA